ncbi:MAG: hypothetical protein WBP26_03795 [Candidatus Saccharimonadales bacterium]
MTIKKVTQSNRSIMNISNRTITLRSRYVLLAALFTLALIVPVIYTSIAQAGTLQQVVVRFDRMKVSTPTTGTVCAQPTTVAAEADVQVTFPTGYTLGAAGDFTVTTTNLAWPAGATAWPGVGTATNVTGQVVTFPSGDLVVGTLYCFNWDDVAAVTVKAAATASNVGSVVTRDSNPTNIDSESYATASITDDQIVVSATVPPLFSFALSGNTDALGNLDTSAVTASPTPRTATVNTNAKNGWAVWAKGANGGLSSATASKTINATTPGSNSTLSAGTEGYNTGITSSQVAGSGTITVTPAFVGAVTGQGGGLDTSLRSLAASDGTAQNAVLTITNNVAIDALTPAASDYTDTITVIGAGLF